MKSHYFLIILVMILFFNNVHATQSVIFSDNFNDGNISDWDVNSGTWIATNLDMNGGNLDGAGISHVLSLNATRGLTISFQAKPGASMLNGEFSWLTDQNGFQNMNGYQIVLQSSTVSLRRMVNGAVTNLITGSGISIQNYHDINITQSGSFFTLKIDGSLIGTAVDSTYSTGSKIFFSTENGAGAFGFDNLVIQSDNSAIGFTILRPKDEKSQNSILKPWMVQQSGPTNYSFIDDNSNSKTFVGDRTATNIFYVDDSNTVNDEYYSRGYAIYISPSDANSYTLQPYLIRIIDGTLINIKIRDSSTNLTIPDIKISLYTPIGSGLTLVESRTTNILGIAQFTMVAQKDYNVVVSDKNNDNTYFSGTIAPVNDQPTILINYFISNTIFNQRNPIITWAPSTDTFTATGSTQRIDFNASVDFDFNYFVVELFDKNTIRNTTTSSNNPFNSNLTATLANFDQNTILARLTIVGKDYNSYFYKTYHFFGTNTDGALGFRKLSYTLSDATIITLIIFAMIGTVFFLGQGFPGNNEAVVFPVAIVGAGLTYLLLPNYSFYMMGALLLAGVLWLFMRLGRS